MDFKKILYATDIETKALSSALTKNAASLRQVGLEEVISLNLAKEEKVSAIMVNLDRKARKGFHRSLIKNLTKTSSVPVLVISSRKHITKSLKRDLFEHVVIAMDWSPASDKALDYFFVFQKLVKALEIVNVINGKLTIKDMRQLNDKCRRL